LKRKAIIIKERVNFSISYLMRLAKMRTDEELIAERNIQIVASALLDTLDVLNQMKVAQNDDTKDLIKDLLDKYGERLKDIAVNGNSV
jgi:hypothetical protein